MIKQLVRYALLLLALYGSFRLGEHVRQRSEKVFQVFNSKANKFVPLKLNALIKTNTVNLYCMGDNIIAPCVYALDAQDGTAIAVAPRDTEGVEEGPKDQ